jgi:hypothetical protein
MVIARKTLSLSATEHIYTSYSLYARTSFTSVLVVLKTLVFLVIYPLLKACDREHFIDMNTFGWIHVADYSSLKYAEQAIERLEKQDELSRNSKRYYY